MKGAFDCMLFIIGVDDCSDLGEQKRGVHLHIYISKVITGQSNVPDLYVGTVFPISAMLTVG